MATSTGKKARRAGGTRFACKRAKAKPKGKRRRFGQLAYSVSKKNADQAVQANAELAAEAAEARRAKGHDPDSTVGVGPDMPTFDQVSERREKAKAAARKIRRERERLAEADDEDEDYE